MRSRTDTMIGGRQGPLGTTEHPFGALKVLHTPSVSVAQARGARLLGQHQIRTRGPNFDAKIYGVSVPGFSLYYMSYGTPLTVVGELAAGSVGVTLPTRGSMSVEHAGKRFLAEPGRAAAIISPAEPLRFEWSDDLEFLCFRIDDRAFQDFFQSVEREPGTAPVRLAPCMVDRAGLVSLLSCARLVDRIAHDDRQNNGKETSAIMVRRVRDHVMTTLAITQPRSDRHVPNAEDGVPASTRAARRARDIVEDGCVLLTPSELANQVGVRLRTLQLGFHSEFGISPQAYLGEARLSRAHADLVRTDSESRVTVAAIAARWGFTNMGRFAKQYQRVYGKRPSETLRQDPA